MIIPLHVACNDSGNGNFAEVAPMIEVLDLRLEARNWWDRPPRFVEVGYDAVRLTTPPHTGGTDDLAHDRRRMPE